MVTIKKENPVLYALKPSINGREYRYKSLELLDFMGYLNKVTGAKSKEEFLSKFVAPTLKWAESDDQKELGDLIVCGPFDMVFSEKAKNILQEYLDHSGVVLPVEVDGLKLFAYKTWLSYNSIGEHDGVAEFVFNRNQKSYLFVSGAVKNIIEQAGLTGFEFELRSDS